MEFKNGAGCLLCSVPTAHQQFLFLLPEQAGLKANQGLGLSFVSDVCVRSPDRRDEGRDEGRDSSFPPGFQEVPLPDLHRRDGHDVG